MIEFQHWKQACRLLEYQVERLNSGNKHFRTLSMFFYRDFLRVNLDIRSEEFFQTYIDSKLFFALLEEFSALNYGVPKGKLGNRPYKLLSTPLRILHYAQGIYLLDLTQTFLDETVRRRKRIASFYGGDLRLNNEGLILKADRVWFFEPYRKFQRRLKSSLRSKPGTTKIVFSFDVASFYERLSLANLIKELEQVLPISTKANSGFTGRRPLDLIEFYRFVMSGIGIPQSDNDVISDFIGYLYLSLVDLSLEDFLLDQLGNMDFQIVRYVDDYYVIIEMPDELATSDGKNLAKDLAERISDLFSERWKLLLNDKAQIFDCSNEEELVQLTNKIKRVSNAFAYIEDENHESLAERAALLLDELEHLKNEIADSGFKSPDFIPEYLRDVYSEQVQNMLRNDENVQRLHSIVENLDFKIVKVCPREITTLFHLYPETWHQYIEFLLSIPQPTNRDVNLMILALCQTSFQETRLLQKLATAPGFREVLKTMLNQSFNHSQISYFDLHEDEAKKLIQSTQMIYQAKRRSFAFKDGNLSLAINHLCSEIIELAHLVRANSGNYQRSRLKANNIVEWMTTLDCSNRDIISIKNLFDRRNNNGISHATNGDTILEEVTIQEYREYLKSVSRLVQRALRIVTASSAD